MTTVPESMITWSGTRHRVSSRPPERSYMADHQCYGAACNSNFPLDTSEQDRPHRGDCKRCFPPAEDFGRHTLTDLERARDVAVALEQQNAALIEFVRPIAGRGCLYGKSGGCNDCSSCHALRLLKDCDAVLAGDAP